MSNGPTCEAHRSGSGRQGLTPIHWEEDDWGEAPNPAGRRLMGVAEGLLRRCQLGGIPPSLGHISFLRYARTMVVLAPVVVSII